MNEIELINHENALKLLEILNNNIEKVNDVVEDETIYILKEKLFLLREHHFKLKEREDKEINECEKTLSKLKNSEKIYLSNINEQKQKLLEKNKELQKNLISKIKLLKYLYSSRLNEIEKIKNQIKIEQEKNEEFNKDKQIIINILNAFIYAINANNIDGLYISNYVNTNVFQAFLDNKEKINNKIIQYFKPLNPEFMFENCIFFKSTLEDVISLLTNNNIQSILIESNKIERNRIK